MYALSAPLRLQSDPASQSHFVDIIMKLDVTAYVRTHSNVQTRANTCKHTHSHYLYAVGAKDWNSLPNELKNITSKQAFRTCVRCYCNFIYIFCMLLFLLYLLPTYIIY